MRIVPLSCANCAAPLDVPAGTRFLTCNYCGSRLEVQENESATFTRVLEGVAQNVERVAIDVEILKMRAEIQELDRRWRIDASRVAGNDRDADSPAVPVFRLMVFSTVGAALFLLESVREWRDWAWIPWIAGFLGLVIVANLLKLRRAWRYQRAKDRYDIRRRNLLRQIDRLELVPVE